MIRPKQKVPAKMVWRISASAPMGEWVQKVGVATPRPSMELPEVSYDSWVTSSYDLLTGTDVIDNSDTVPSDLFDDLFAHKPGTTQSHEK